MQDLIDKYLLEEAEATYSLPVAKALKSIESAILLNEIVKLWINNGRKPFYKFKEPCNSEFYKQGESWLESLGFSKRNFDTALQKLKQSKNGKSISVIETRTDINRRTFYYVNEDRLCSFLNGEFSLDTKDHLYLLYNPKTNLLKIGRSKDVKKRIASIKRTLKSDSIYLVKEILDKGDLETYLLDKFKNHNVTGEWFKDVPEIREFFKNFK